MFFSKKNPLMPLLGLIMTAALLCGQAAEAQETPPPAEAFAYLPTYKFINISPNGENFLTVINSENIYTAAVFGFDGSNANFRYAMAQDDHLQMRKFRWKRDDRIIFSVRATGERSNMETIETRMFYMDPDGQNLIPAFRVPKKKQNNNFDTSFGVHDRDGLAVQIQDNILNMLPNDPEHILIGYGQAVYKASVDKTGNHRTVQRPRDDIYWWDVDHNGEAVIGTGFENVTSDQRVLLLKGSDGKWKDFSERLNGPNYFAVLAASEDPDKFYVLSNHETETDALYLFDITTDSFSEQLFHTELSDVYGIKQDPFTGKATGVYYAEDETEIRWLDDTPAARMAEKLRQALPGKTIRVTSVNRPQTHMVVNVAEEGRPGRLFIFDSTRNKLSALAPQYPQLENVPMGKVISTTYEARDGLTIPAYVTLPPGYGSLGEARDLPFVVFPHGGPQARDFTGFDYMTQFFASRGYGVLQMNFRGSAGYGQEFQEAGKKQWGQAMQDDITDGAAWLVTNGYANKDKIAIVGGSYGGYAALMGAIRTPEVYQCAVSLAGVADLPDLLQQDNRFVGSRFRTRFIGDIAKDRAQLTANSPVDNADKVGIPILLVHGEYDFTVPAHHSQRMASALKRNGKEYKHVVLPKGDHYLSLYQNRLTFLKETEQFLNGCLH